MKVYYDKDANLDIVQGKKIAVIGYGSQGHAHANNLKESGMDVIVAEYPKGGDNWTKAEKAGSERSLCGEEAHVRRGLTEDVPIPGRHAKCPW